MNEAVVDMEDLRVVRGRRTLLAIDRLCVSSGEVVGIIGPNGAGKTTLLKTCLGLERISGGRVSVLGMDLVGLGGREVHGLRCRIGYVPQGLTGRSEMPITVREVVAIGRTGRAGLLRSLGAADWHVVDEWIDRVGLSGLADRSYGTLSGGEQRRALLARAMVQEPEMLLLDEPACHLDPGGREQMVGMLDDLYGRTKTAMIMVCHELDAFPVCCRRIVILEQGQVADEGEPERVLTDHRVGRLYGASLTVRHVDGRHFVTATTGGGWHG